MDTPNFWNVAVPLWSWDSWSETAFSCIDHIHLDQKHRTCLVYCHKLAALVKVVEEGTWYCWIVSKRPGSLSVNYCTLCLKNDTDVAHHSFNAHQPILRGNVIRTALCWIVWHNVHSLQHMYMSSSYRSNRLGLWHWDHYAVHRGSCLELYYCGPTGFLHCFDTVDLVIWPVKIIPKMTYYVSSGTLNPTHSLTHSLTEVTTNSWISLNFS